MSAATRQIQGFYEARGNFAMPKDRARQIFEGSLEITSRYAGPLVLESLVGIELPSPANPINVQAIRLGDARHAALVTRRSFVGKKVPTVPGSCIPDPQSSRTFVQYDPNGLNATDYSIGVGVHEFSHSLGIVEHCNDTSCIMQAGLYPKQVVTLLANPFCDNCAEELVLAGHYAMPTRASAPS